MANPLLRKRSGSSDAPIPVGHLDERVPGRPASNDGGSRSDGGSAGLLLGSSDGHKAAADSVHSRDVLDDSPVKKKRKKQWRSRVLGPNTLYLKKGLPALKALLARWSQFEKEPEKMKHIRALYAQIERCPKTLRLHIQYFLQGKHQFTSMKQVFDLLETKHHHLSDKTLNSNYWRAQYCIKTEETCKVHDAEFPSCKDKWVGKGVRTPETVPVIIGVPVKPRERTDIKDCMFDFKQNPRQSLVGMFEKHPGPMVKYHRMERYKSLVLGKKIGQYIPDLKVHVFWGGSRTNKERTVFEQSGGAENVYVWTIPASGLPWMDGYADQKILLIKEFYGQLPIRVMQNVLDHYIIRMQCKGGFVISNWDKIFITSNAPPKKWYNSWVNSRTGLPYAEEIQRSMENRISSVTHFKTLKVDQKPVWAKPKPGFKFLKM